MSENRSQRRRAELKLKIVGLMGLPPPTVVQSVSLFKVGTECGWCGEVFEGDGMRSNEDMQSICSLVFAG